MLAHFALDRGFQLRQYLGGHTVAFFLVWKVGKDELVDPQAPVGEQFRDHLLRFADNSCAEVDAYPRDAVPETRSLLCQLGLQLCLLTDHRRTLEGGSALGDDPGIGLRDQLLRGVPGLALSRTDYDVSAEAEEGPATLRLVLNSDSVEQRRDIRQWLDPGEVGSGAARCK